MPIRALLGNGGLRRGVFEPTPKLHEPPWRRMIHGRGMSSKRKSSTISPAPKVETQTSSLELKSTSPLYTPEALKVSRNPVLRQPEKRNTVAYAPFKELT